MKNVHKTEIVGYSAEEMYALVEDMEKYPDFLPWCSGIHVKRDMENNQALVTMFIDFYGLQNSFTTRNYNTVSHSINIKLVKGPFRHLDGTWTFIPLGKRRSRVDLELNYQFSSQLSEIMLEPIFEIVSRTLVDSFRQRAKTVYG